MPPLWSARKDEMRRLIAIPAAAIVLMLAAVDSNLLGCTWAIDYFYQVTNLKGTVVGSNFPVLHSFRWYRQSVVRPKSKLSLYDFCWPRDVLSGAPVETVVADSHGKFDFGLLKAGHYSLKIEDEKGELSAVFQIEVKDAPNPKESEIIDISPNYPDCTGGHEFIIRAN